MFVNPDSPLLLSFIHSDHTIITSYIYHIHCHNAEYIFTFDLLVSFPSLAEDGTDNSDHEREWEKQQLQKARASAKVCAPGVLFRVWQVIL